MSVIHDRSDVARVLGDPAWLVPEAAPGDSPFERLRGGASRFVNGPAHDERRATLESRLAELDPESLARTARSLARSALAAGSPPSEVARRVPVQTLAVALGLAGPGSAPADAAALAAPYATGVAADGVDAAAARLLASVPARDRPGHEVLDAQLLVQAHAATSGLIAEVLSRAAHSPGVATVQLIEIVLRDAPPVGSTRRLAPPRGEGPPGDEPGARLVELRLDGPDRDATATTPPRTLAFGAGPRRCPASRHAVAIAAAVVEELRESAC